MSCPADCRTPTPAQAHCPTCHRTFGGVYGFDSHRRNGRCIDPEGLPMVERDGIWRALMTPAKQAQLAALAASRVAPDA